MNPVTDGEKMLKAGQLNAMGLIDEIFHYVCSEYRKAKNPRVFEKLLTSLNKDLGEKAIDQLLLEFNQEFPPVAVYQGELTEEEYLAGTTDGIPNKVATLEELILLHLANENPAFTPFMILYSDETLAKNKTYLTSWAAIQKFFKTQPSFGPNDNDLITMLREPAVFSPTSIKGQLDYIRQNWASFMEEWLRRLLSGMDMIAEEEKPGWSGNFSGPPPMDAYSYDSLMQEYERFSPDREWMPRVVLMAKTVLVWLDQLSKKYKRTIQRLDEIPDEELDALAQAGFTGLWLIGLWERSWGSKRIKQKCGNPEAAASAYSLHDYDIAQQLGGWDALDNLRRRLWYRGIRLASDMVPNHTGMDSKWVVERPDLFVQRRDCPYPQYSFNDENLSLDPRISVYLEDHYYSKSDCAVVYKRVDNATGDTRYIYHGNDGTGMAWNDTAQIDFLNPEAREAVIQEILHVARNFPIIRFDAAMVLAKKHIRRLWYPEPGQGGDIATRSEYAISRQEFEDRIPNEFWREVVDRCAQEVPDTLLLAEAFWMMEGYFVRTLGMHRVYNSAFMNMLKREENQKYRDTVKNTIEFDPEVLKRFVNFMNNPDEETAVAQFGKGDKYFGVCTLMVTMPGLPMFGHGQIEGFEEKYGMEYTKAYKNEEPDYGLIEGHKHDIFPLMKKRYLFSGIENFCFFDVWNEGVVNENVFAYSNRYGDERAIVFYNNKYEPAAGWIKESCRFAVKDADGNIHQETRNLADGLGLSTEPDTFLIFQEQHSGLWYIREVAELREHGMFTMLNGFQYQVLWNMTEVRDDATGKWRTLCTSLNGKGVKNIDVALKEIFLKELYGSLEAFATEDLFKAVTAVAAGKEKDSVLKAALKTAKEAGITYFDTLVTFINGNYGAQNILKPAAADAATAGKKAVAGAKKATAKTTLAGGTSEAAWKNFEKRIRLLVSLAQNKAVAKDATKAQKSFGATMAEILSDSDYAASLTAYLMAVSVQDILGKKTTALDTQKLITLWRLDRKLRDLLVDQGHDETKLFTIFRSLRETTCIADMGVTAASWQKDAATIVDYLTKHELAWELLGLNTFGDTVWYNKEKAEVSFASALVLYTLCAAKPVQYESLEKLRTLIAEAAEKSEYKVALLVQNVQPPVKKATATAKKPTAAKPTAEKKPAAKKPKAKKTDK